MPELVRVRRNFLNGAVSVELSATGTELSATGLTSVPVITSGVDYLVITLDPDGTNGAPEIVHITAHADAAGTATILRGQEGTTARIHPINTVWRHAATKEDFASKITVPGWVQDLHTPLGDGPEGAPTFDDSFNESALHADWVKVLPSGSTTWTQRRGLLSVTTASQTGGHASALLRPYSLPVGHCVETRATTIGPNVNYIMAGPIATNGTATTNNVVWLMPFSHTGVASKQMSVRAGTFTGNTTLGEHQLHYQSATSIYLRLRHVSANTWNIGYSPDGVSWRGFSNYSYTMTPTHVGVAVSTWGTAETMLVSFDYVRVYAA